MSDRDPIRFGKYLLLERIGIGGMAEVFKAKVSGAEGFERLVAIKRILPHLVEDDDFVNMFVDEAKIAVRLSHPNIVGVQDLGKAEGTLYIAMEYVLGKDLRALYDVEKERESRTPIGIACHIVMKMCEALHHAHFATGPRGEPLQVIHRDVSPQNVLISVDGEVKVADFGLAKARGRMVQTQAGVVKGKLAYMSPEQLRGEDIDHRVDVFGLGIVLYELLTGERLFLGPSDMDTLRRVYEARVPPLQPLNPDVHPDLEAIVRQALAKDRDVRYATALDLHDDLQAFVYGHGCYCGASSLRSYLREAFPDTAPTIEPELPFAPPPAEPALPTPRPTLRPPALSKREEVAPAPMPGGLESVPPVDIDVDLDLDAVLAAPPVMQESGLLQPPPFEDATSHEAVARYEAPQEQASGGYPAGAYASAEYPAADYPAEYPAADYPAADYPAEYPAAEYPAADYPAADYPAAELDDRPTDRPPPMDLPPEVAEPPAVLTHRVIETGRPPPPESSGTVPSGDHGFPSLPPGLYDEYPYEEEYPTEQLPGDLLVPPGPDTKPAPPMPADESLNDFVSEGWTEDEPTLYNPGALAPQTGTNPRPEASVPDEEDDWGDDATVVGDPRTRR